MAYDPCVSVIYESPHRLQKTLKDLLAHCGDRQALVCRELTKIHEQVTRASLSELIARFREPPKGEVTIVLEGKRIDGDGLTDEELRVLIRTEVERGKSAKDISSALAQALGIKKKKVYEIAVAFIAENR